MLSGLVGLGAVAVLGLGARNLWFRWRLGNMWRKSAWSLGCDIRPSKAGLLKVFVPGSGTGAAVVRLGGVGMGRRPRVSVEFFGPGFSFSSRTGLAKDLMARLDSRVWGSGDARFDQAYRARVTDPLAASAALGHEAREASLEVASLLENGDVPPFRRGPTGIADPDWVEGLLVRVRAAATAMDAPPDGIAPRLAVIALRDPLPGVRVKALRLLVERFSRASACRSVCETLANDGHGPTALWAAVGLGEDGVGRCVDACGTVGDEEWIEAADLLLGRVSPEGRSRLMMRALEGEPGARRREQALEWIAAFQHRPALGRLTELGDAADGKELVSVIGVFQHIGDASAEPALLRWLERGDAAVRAACAIVLGEIGTAAAVEPLLKAVRRAGPLDDFFKEKARGAVARIQSRLGPAEKGALALTDARGTEGAVSLGTEGGEVSEGGEDSGSR